MQIVNTGFLRSPTSFCFTVTGIHEQIFWRPCRKALSKYTHFREAWFFEKVKLIWKRRKMPVQPFCPAIYVLNKIFWFCIILLLYFFSYGQCCEFVSLYWYLYHEPSVHPSFAEFFFWGWKSGGVLGKAAVDLDIYPHLPSTNSKLRKITHLQKLTI